MEHNCKYEEVLENCVSHIKNLNVIVAQLLESMYKPVVPEIREIINDLRETAGFQPSEGEPERTVSPEFQAIKDYVEQEGYN